MPSVAASHCSPSKSRLKRGNGGKFQSPMERSQPNYEQCASQLLNHDLDEDTIALACATAFSPTELSACVSEIDNAT
ncbi:MAG: hypothetical protein HC795_16375 [Coleofasciculaceae cyanobacterium RL_1_1]|nr:hypothetical protein [Coleofasciculaceae cyanobacterium RL_1_1]